MKKKIGVGTLSFVLFITGLIWVITLKDSVCLGDIVLNSIGLKAWSNGRSGTHYAVFYSLIFFIPSFVIGLKFSNDTLAKFGKTGSIVLTCFIAFITFFMIRL
jgi:hypothetical protein